MKNILSLSSVCLLAVSVRSAPLKSLAQLETEATISAKELANSAYVNFDAVTECSSDLDCSYNTNGQTVCCLGSQTDEDGLGQCVTPDTTCSCSANNECGDGYYCCLG